VRSHAARSSACILGDSIFGTHRLPHVIIALVFEYDFSSRLYAGGGGEKADFLLGN
jgi:hypothetical protein